jgi:hypothetical protein
MNAKTQQQVGDLIERVVVAALVAYITFRLTQSMVGLDHDGAGEVAFLNAGLAYYTHQASGNLATIIASIAGWLAYHLVKRWQKDRRSR